jgi:hypothetical protein
MRVTSSLIGSLDFKLVIYFVFACNLSSRSGDCVLFLLTIDRPFKLIVPSRAMIFTFLAFIDKAPSFITACRIF